MSMPREFLRAPPSSVQMGLNKYSGLIRKTWFIVMMIVRVRSEQKVEAASSGLFCISDCSTCPLICSPPPQILITTPHPPPPSATAPPPPPPPPPPPFKPYNTPPSGLAQPQPTVISAPHDFSYPYYYFYASAASSSLSLHAPLYAFLFSLIAYSILGT